MPTSTRPEHLRPLAALFAALLAGCTGREVTPGETSDGTSSTGSTGTGSDTTEPTSSSSTSTSSGSVPGEESYEPPECVYADHDIVLTAEQYDAWLHGMGEVDGSSTGDETGTGTDTTVAGSTAGDTDTADTTIAGSTAGDTTADTTIAGSTAGDTGSDDTTGEVPWSFELCVQICAALTDADEWDIESCEKTATDPDGAVHIRCVELVEACDGRSHACITSRGAVSQADPVAAHFARAAHDEAASVYAFAALADELEPLGAAPALLERVRSAAADEVRHARVVSRLAAERGARCRPPARRDLSRRGALEIAVENAVEGCVRETWAALLAAHQAEHAGDLRVRAAMRAIAADEARHAELAWAIDAWLTTLVDADGRAEIAAARAAAAASVLASAAAHAPAPALVEAAGLPGRAAAAHLARGLADALWAA